MAGRVANVAGDVRRDLEVLVLGPVAVHRHGTALPVTALKHRMILAALALRVGEDASPDLLIDALWAGRPPPTAAKALRVYVSELRRIIEPDPRTPAILTSHPSGYRLAIDPEAVDLHRFERLWRTGRELLSAGDAAGARSALAAALSLFRGDPLADLRFEDFFAPEARRLEELQVEALEDRIDADLACGARGGVIAELESLVERYPLRERLRGELMLALYQAGRQADALAAYRDAREHLVDQLGIDPSPALAGLERRILQQDPSLAEPAAGAQPQAGGPPVFALPAAVSALVGREQELAELVELLRRPETRLVTLTGPGGSGKTRLAIEIAWQAVAGFKDGVAFAELASIADPELVPAAIGAALAVEESGDQTTQEAVTAFLRRRELLLVLDNFEHVAEAWKAVAGLLRACPHLTIMVTSRARLRITGEHEHAVEPLAQDAALELLVARLPVSGAEDWDAGELAAGREICRRLDCLPLAIELVAARGRLAGPTQLLPRLEGGLKLLTDGPRDLPARQRTLRATLDWSYDLLGGDERRALSELAVFAGGFTRESASAVLGSDADVIEALAEASLVRRGANGSRHHRLALLEVVREYAWERAEPQHRGETSSRHAQHFADLASRAALEIHGADQIRWFDLLDLEHPNIRAALAFFISADAADRALGLAADLAWFWYVRGYWTEGRSWLQQALDLRGGDDISRSRALLGAGIIAREQGSLAEAGDLLEQAVGLSAGDDHAHGLAVNELAGVAFYEDAPERAITLAENALAILGRSSDQRRRSEVLGNVALISQALRNHADAERLFDEALAELRRSGDIYASILVRNNFFLFCSERSDDGLMEARAGLVGTLELAGRLRSRKLECYLLDSVAFVSLRMGDLDTAWEYHRRALAAMTGVESVRVQGGALETAGALARHSEQYAEAVTLLLVAGRLRELTDTAQAALAEAQAELASPTLAAVTDAAASMSVGAAIELTLDIARSAGTERSQ